MTYRESLLNAGLESDRRESALALTYRAQFGGLALHPVALYAKNPDTNPQVRDAFAAALRFTYAMR